MIHNETELLQTLEQINRMYRALADLRKSLEPRNRDNFLVFAEGPIDEIKKMRAEVDAYLGISSQFQPVTTQPVTN